MELEVFDTEVYSHSSVPCACCGDGAGLVISEDVARRLDVRDLDFYVQGYCWDCLPIFRKVN
jgi:transposase